MSRYTLPETTLFVTSDVARDLAVLLGPGRRTFEARVDGHPDTRAWLNELDALVPASPLPRPETVWISTVEAAAILALSPRQVRNLAGKIRAQRRGRVLMFDAADVYAEHEARTASPIARSGNPSDAVSA